MPGASRSRKTTTQARPGASHRAADLTSNKPWLLVFGQAAVVFGPELAMRWMKKPCLALENRIPADLAATPAGRKQVLAELSRIEHGFTL